MQPPVTIVLLVFDGIQILDVTGPAAVFAAANDAIGSTHYAVHIVSPQGGEIQSNSAIALATQPIQGIRPNAVDTLLIAGGDDDKVLAFAAHSDVKQWVVRASKSCRRYGSICSGALALAHYGLLDGKQATTHWSTCADLAAHYPMVHVDADALYVQDGRLWTSAGVTTGVDMCLAMVAADVGEAVSNAIARRLVLYAKRPGYQSQFSPVLTAQAKAAEQFSDLVNWMREHLAEPLKVARLAERAAMSQRSFHRNFTQCMAQTPAHFVESLRLEKARLLLAAMVPIKSVAVATGYGNAGQLSKAFERRIGMPPSLYRGLHGTDHSQR